MGKHELGKRGELGYTTTLPDVAYMLFQQTDDEERLEKFIPVTRRCVSKHKLSAYD